MPNINDMLASKWLKQSDFPEPKDLTIKDVTRVNMAKDGEPEEYKFAMHFSEIDRAMVLNKTNIKRAAKFLESAETNDWIGRTITVYNDEEVEFGGDIVGGLRLRKATQQGPHGKAPF